MGGAGSALRDITTESSDQAPFRSGEPGFALRPRERHRITGRLSELNRETDRQCPVLPVESDRAAQDCKDIEPTRVCLRDRTPRLDARGAGLQLVLGWCLDALPVSVHGLLVGSSRSRWR